MNEQDIRQKAIRDGLKIGKEIHIKQTKECRRKIEISFINAKVIDLFPSVFLVEIQKSHYKRRESFQYKQILLREIKLS